MMSQSIKSSVLCMTEQDMMGTIFAVGFLNLETIDILGWNILCCGEELSCALQNV